MVATEILKNFKNDKCWIGVICSRLHWKLLNVIKVKIISLVFPNHSSAEQ